MKVETIKYIVKEYLVSERILTIDIRETDYLGRGKKVMDAGVDGERGYNLKEADKVRKMRMVRRRKGR